MTMKIKLHENNADVIDDIVTELDDLEYLVEEGAKPAARGPNGGEITLQFNSPKGPQKKGNQVVYQLIVSPWVYDINGRIFGKGGKTDRAYTITLDVDTNNKMPNSVSADVNILIQQKEFTDKGYSRSVPFIRCSLKYMIDCIAEIIVNDLEDNGYFG